MSEFLAAVIIVIVSAGFWARFPNQIPETWQGPVEQWMIDRGQWVVTLHDRLTER